MRQAAIGRFCPGSSRLHRTDARAKLCGLILLSAAIIISDSWVGYLLSTAVVLSVVALSALGLGAAWAAISRLRWFFVIVFMLNALFYSQAEPLWQEWIFSLSLAGIRQGFAVIFRVVLIMLLANVLTLTTPPLQLTAALQALLSPLRWLRLPADEVAMILTVAINFIPTLLEEAETIKLAQTARGAHFDSKRPRQRVQALLSLVLPIFMASFRRADELATAMEARGYRGASGRTPRQSQPLDASGCCALSLCGLVCAAQLLIRL